MFWLWVFEEGPDGLRMKLKEANEIMGIFNRMDDAICENFNSITLKQRVSDKEINGFWQGLNLAIIELATARAELDEKLQECE